jgi:hypothetical protein
MRHKFGCILSAFMASLAAVAAPQSPSVVRERYVAIDNVCAWPNLTVLPDGSVVATIFNQPTHGGWQGDVDCWATRDGRFWEKRGTPAPHEPATNRMNVAAGLARDGSLIVLASGWSNRPEPGTFRGHRIPDMADILPLWICRSTDQGRTWTRGDRPLPPPPGGPTRIIPFGDIVQLTDGTLGVCIYSWSPATKEHNSYFYVSRDDGRTWSLRGVVRKGNINETTPVVLRSGRLLAAARTLDDQHLDLLGSDDHGATWTTLRPVTAGLQHPADLTLLTDGRLLLSYGNRVKGRFGVEAKLSADDGVTWSEPIPLVDDLVNGDCGYPASVERSGGEVLTAYYASGAASHRRYHMGVVVWKLPAAPPAKAAIPLGTQRELFVDDHLIDELSGASLQLHRPVEREVVLRCDRPWEGAVCGYFNVFQDGHKYRMYYRGWDARFATKKLTIGHPAVLCYAESTDGVHWTRPSLGLFEFQGSKDNNIVWIGKGFDNVAVFKDTNPRVPEGQRYKALGGYPLVALVSADGLHWERLQEKPVITKGAFDSQNLAFYDNLRRQYVAYYRGFRQGVRDILVATSPDFVHWNDDRQQWIVRSAGTDEHLYTSAATPYFRAPQIYVAFPMRYEPTRPMKEGKNDGMSGVTDAVFMTSRDGVHFDRRFLEAFIRPGLDQGRWITRNNMPAWGLVATKAQDVEGQEELSVYWTERYYTPACRLRRGTLRLDGFVSVNAPFAGGQLITKPFTFTGRSLAINYSTSAAGSVVVELQQADGRPIAGHDAGSCPEIFGDAIEHVVTWKNGADVSKYAGQPVRLRFVLKDADLYSIQFKP